MEGQAVNNTINRARSAKQLKGVLKHSIWLGLEQLAVLDFSREDAFGHLMTSELVVSAVP